ncbi:MAG TPA: hypothetical protein VMB05_00505, partial [Solirubrobacteraceae bacterium]|nr:hypothetical protein [Solirubrobacteraceae bacterium]
LQATIGPKGLTYLERIGSKLVPYRPRGVLLPVRCPRRGYPFASSLSFLDGSSSTASTRVWCH